MEERELRALETIFAHVEDPRMERTRVAPIARYHHHRHLRSDVWSGRMGRHRRIWESEGRLAHRVAAAAQWHSLA